MLSGDDILNRQSASFQQKLGSDNEDYTSHNEDYSDSDCVSSSPSTKGSVVVCSSEEEAPSLCSFPSSPRISNVKKQKIACDKRERTDIFTRDLSSSTPRRIKRKVVQPKQLSHGKYASKCVEKAKSKNRLAKNIQILQVFFLQDLQDLALNLAILALKMKLFLQDMKNLARILQEKFAR